MRRSTAIAVFALLTACGSSVPTDGTTPPPPAPTPGAPATVTLITGDGQTAAPGASLPTKLAVQVKDAAGLTVPGVTVHFAIDTGGGSLSATSGVTGSDGTVSGITWTLGSGSGSNVVAVTVNSLAPVRFHATATGPATRTILNNTAVGAAGGTFTYSKSGDALNGLTLSVTPGSFATTTPWSIVADSSLTVPLPAGFSQVGPTLVINTGQGFADSNMTLTMPMHIGADMAVAPFYYDPASGTLEGIPLLGRTATSATLATKHFSADLMAIPGQGAVGSLRASLRQGFGAVRVVWVMIPQAQLVGTFTSGFTPGNDDWEFANYGDYIAPGGDCEGMSITAMYYHYFFRLGGSPAPGLYHHFDQSIPNQWDNVQGIRYAGSVQGDMEARFQAGLIQMVTIAQAAQGAGTLGQDLTQSWIVLTLKLTHRPVLLALQRPGGGHAVVAYAVTSDAASTTVSVADPNRPGNTSAVLSYIQGILVPAPFQTSATTSGHTYTSSYALGVSAEVPMNQLSQRWAEFAAQRAGADRYPANYHVQILNPVDTTWSTLTSSVVSYAPSARFRTVCGDCFKKNPPDGAQDIVIWNAAGSQHAYDSIVPLTATPVSLNALAVAAPDFGASGFVDVVPFTIVYRNVTINGPTAWDPGVPLAFVVQNPPNVPGVHYQYAWDFGDGTTPSGATDSPNMIHTYAVTGVRTINLTIIDLQTGHVIVRTSLANTVGTPTAIIDVSIRGSWPNNTAPPIGDYQYTDLHGSRAVNPTLGLDALLIFFDPYTPDNVLFDFGVELVVMVPTGSALHAGQTFTKWVSGPPSIGAGQFQLALAQDMAHPENGTVAPGNSGTFTITSVTTLTTGATAITFTFTISNGFGGTVTGSGTWGYK